MKIGIPKEIKHEEHRVSLLPAAAAQLVKRGHQVLVERGAGVGSGYSDKEYEKAGARMIKGPADVFAEAEMIVKVKEPLKPELKYLRPGQLLFTYLHLAADRELTDGLLKSGVTGVAFETLAVNHRLPLLEPMSEIAGRMSIIVGSYFLAKHNGGSGVLVNGVPGVAPANVLVLGGGTAGFNAAHAAHGLGAQVTVLEVDAERMSFIENTLPGVRTLYSSETQVLDLLPTTDLLIGAVLLPGAKTPKLVRKDMLHLMRPGSVLVDIAIDQGGCVETSKPTTHTEPVFTVDGVTHYCVANMPGAYARTATQALAGATYRYVQLFADKGLKEACRIQPSILSGINVQAGKITNKAVAEAHGLPLAEIVL